MDGRWGDAVLPPSGSFELTGDAGGSVLHLRGDVDAPVVQEMEVAGVDPRAVVAVDVGALTYIDSTGLSMLVRWAQHARGTGRPALIRRPTPRFVKVLEVAGISPLFQADGP
ncbi:STAS domain-containing protein [Geodermatophilus ruber]|uniref:Anti-anti-sigma factor n=1 Tax=Geodermatophilus ruber TaxID=504800 RepID=A0A1I4HUM1_9ACTN|nr:STAS domain-containing protein [Geodermatophilus ruber]SFL45473.1 anti-anti-sigma factor [Geodermatophilus ruber]